MELTPNEIQFLQRLIGHHCTGINRMTEDLYEKLANHAEFIGVKSDKPLDLYSTTGENPDYNNRVTFAVNDYR